MEIIESTEMVYSSCVAWFSDWTTAYSPPLVDEWDLSTWIEEEMNDALRVFLVNSFNTHRARNDAIMICRALFYEYFLFEKERARMSLVADPQIAAVLPTLPQSVQKSAIWHTESYNMLSGHEFGKVVIGGPATRESAIIHKCGIEPVLVDADVPLSQHVFITPSDGRLSPFKWGWRFESVARQIFEFAYAGGEVFDGLGRVRHPFLPRLGASPDGLIINGPRCGRLVELKCPITRTLTDSIPMEYWIQMQLQAEVCNVEAVEYFEISFGSKVLPTIGVSASMLPFECTAPPYAALPWFGFVRVVAPSIELVPESMYEYDYSPLFPSTADGVTDALAWLSVPLPSKTILETSVWWVRDAQYKTVMRNRRWWDAVGEPAYRTFWIDVDAARAEGRYATVSRPLFVEMEEDMAPCAS